MEARKLIEGLSVPGFVSLLQHIGQESTKTSDHGEIELRLKDLRSINSFGDALAGAMKTALDKLEEIRATPLSPEPQQIRVLLANVEACSRLQGALALYLLIGQVYLESPKEKPDMGDARDKAKAKKKTKTKTPKSPPKTENPPAKGSK